MSTLLKLQTILVKDLEFYLRQFKVKYAQRYGHNCISKVGRNQYLPFPNLNSFISMRRENFSGPV